MVGQHKHLTSPVAMESYYGSGSSPLPIATQTDRLTKWLDEYLTGRLAKNDWLTACSAFKGII